jgi:hypothetical protein
VAPPIEHHQPPPENIQSEAIVQPKALTPVTTPKNVQVKSTRLPGTPIPLKMMDIDDELLEENQSIANRKGQREIKPPARYNDPDFTHLSQEGISIDSEGEYAMMVLTVDGDTSLQGIPESPKTFQEANKSQKWRQAMQDEYDALLANQTWELSELPKGRKAIGCKWTFKLKQNGDGSIARYKARLIAKGYTQREGVDFTETYAPVAKFTTIRSMFALAAVKGYNVTQMDVSTAYLHANVEEDLYMEQPLGYQLTGESGEKLVCKLKKSIYGLKQAGRNWNKTIDAWLKEHGLIASQYDPCLYTSKKEDDRYFAMAIYVDDLICLDNDIKYREEVKQILTRKFKITDIGTANWVLGMRINITKDHSIEIDQFKYTNDILRRYGLEECKTAVTPISEEKDTTKKNSEPADKEEYMSMVGSLIYLAVVTRPDISYAVGRVGQRMSNPDKDDMIAAKRILRYVRANPVLGPIYVRHGEDILKGYADADWGGDKNTRRSTTGYLFTLAGAAISWCSKRQVTVALSSAEAEYMAVSWAAQEAIHLRGLLEDLGLPQEGPTVIYQDN